MNKNSINNEWRNVKSISKVLLSVSIFVVFQIFTQTVCLAQNHSDILTQWLKLHKPAEFTGQVWARVQVVEPENYLYNVVIDSETNPYTPARIATGTLAKSGLKPKKWVETGNDWGKPLVWIPPTSDDDWIKSGQSSDWVKLPVSTAAQWHTAFFIKGKSEPINPIMLKLEFASQPKADAIFHVVEEKTDDKLAVVVRMPTSSGVDGLKMLKSLTEWAESRRELVKSLKLSPPPRLNDLKIGTWITFGNYRVDGGNAVRSRVESDFQNIYDLGINMVSATDGIDDDLFREMAQKYHVTDTTLTAWANNWKYTSEAAAGKYDFQPNENPDQHWARVFADFYGKYAADVRKKMPFRTSIAEHINLGDEISAATNSEEISKTPQILAYFHEWLKQQNLTPAMLDAASWKDVQPTENRAKIGTSVGYARRFYYTRQFINHYTALYYRNATDAVERQFPEADLIAVNYQAGLMQFGFVGNNNDLNKGQLDIFELGRTRALKGVMTEDWVEGRDLGIGREGLGVQMMRAAARKHDLPLAGYLVGGEAVRAEYFGYLMNGIKETGLYLYGPYSNIGPAWSEDKNALTQIADVSRRVKKFEPIIAKAQPRPAKVALLIAATSDIMQVNGLYFCPERQNLYIAMQHAYVPVEVVSEQDILLDDRLKDYAMLMVSDPQVRGDVQEKIGEWVKNGGHLWASVGAMNWDEFNQPSRTLDKVFGVKDRKVIFQKDGIQPSKSSWTSDVSKFNYQQIDTLKTNPLFFSKAIEIPVWGAKLDSAPTTAKIIGSYKDGKPAIFLNKYGKGEAMLVGAMFGEAYINQHYPQNLLKDGNLLPDWKFDLGTETTRLATDFVERAKINRPLSLSVPGVYTSVMETPEATLVFLNNATGHPLSKVTVRLRDAGKIRLIQSTLSDKIAYQIKDNEIIFDIPLKDADIVYLKR
ncbi:MAG: beta-galactosidase trimerization domain-containing protein [Acidobacteriota bacterium]